MRPWLWLFVRAAGLQVLGLRAGRHLASARAALEDDVCSTAPCEQNCTAADGIYKCSCFGGFDFVRSGAAIHGACVDIDECAVNNGGCSQVCVNEPGSHRCECARGFEPNGTSHGGYYYYTPAPNATVAGNVTELATELVAEADATISSNLTLSPLVCVDIDECALDLCAHNCMNLPGSHQCSCRPGFELLPDQRNCTDIDECAVPGVCNHFCNNKVGGFECGCFQGFAMSAGGTCEDVDECTHRNGGCAHFCHNNAGSYFCSCREGFQEVFGRCIGALDTPAPESWPHFMDRRLNATGKFAAFHSLTGPGAGVTTQPAQAASVAAELEPVHTVAEVSGGVTAGLLAARRALRKR